MQYYNKWKDKQKEYRKEIKLSKKVAWNKMMKSLDENPWDKPYKIVLKKLNNSPGNNAKNAQKRNRKDTRRSVPDNERRKSE